MSSSNAQTAPVFEKLIRVAKWVVVGIVLLAGMFFVFRILDVMMAWQIYSWFFQPLVESGMPETLSGAIAVWFMAAVMFILPTFIYSIGRDRKKALLIIATAVSAWFVVVYFVSLPKEGQLFNPISGKAMYRYSDTADGKIKLFPLGYRYDPETGDMLKDLTSDVAKKHGVASRATLTLKTAIESIPICRDRILWDSAKNGNIAGIYAPLHCWSKWISVSDLELNETDGLKMAIEPPKELGGWVELMLPHGKVISIKNSVYFPPEITKFRIRAGNIRNMMIGGKDEDDWVKVILRMVVLSPGDYGG